MIRLFPIILLSFILFNSIIFAQPSLNEIRSSDLKPKFSGFIPIASYYIDQGTKEKVLISGSCLIFKYLDSQKSTRLFGITSAHVTQGGSDLVVNDLSFNSKNSPEILGRLANNDDDIELIEFKNNLFQPMADWNQEDQFITISLDEFKTWKDNHPFKENSVVKMTKNNEIPSNIVMKGAWVHSFSQDFSQKYGSQSQFNFGISESNFDQLIYFPIENEVQGNAIVGSGMSGSPLLSVIKPYSLSEIQNGNVQFGGLNILENLFALKYHVIGITKGNRRNQPGSLFASAHPIAQLINAYINKSYNNNDKAGYLSPTRWNLRYGLTYRTFDNQSSEIIPSTQRLGGFGKTDGGGFTKTDGGDSRLNMEGPNNQVSPFDHWQNFNISPSGIKYKNSNILGFTLVDGVGFYVDGNPNLVLDYFDLSFLKKWALAFRGVSISTDSIPVDTNFISLLKKKFLAFSKQIKREDELKISQLNSGQIPINRELIYNLRKDIWNLKFEENQNSNLSDKAYLLKLLEFKTNTVQPYIEKFLNHKDSKSFILMSNTKNNDLNIEDFKIEIADNKIQFHLLGPNSQSDKISFTLDKNGKWIDENNITSPYFQPILRVKSGQKFYLVDLRSLFFVDTSRFTLQRVNPSVIFIDKKQELSADDLVHMLLEGPLLRIKDEKHSQIYEVQFNMIETKNGLP